MTKSNAHVLFTNGLGGICPFLLQNKWLCIPKADILELRHWDIAKHL